MSKNTNVDNAMNDANTQVEKVSLNSFDTLDTLRVGAQEFHYYSLARLQEKFPLEKLPFCWRILLENLLRKEDGVNVTQQDIESICTAELNRVPTSEIAFSPARVVLQDFTGVPAVVDLAAMRDAVVKLGGDADVINPQVPVDLVIDHSVMVDYFASEDALKKNTDKEFERNLERYNFLRWGQKAFSNFRVVPPGTGIVHQVNLEYLGKVVMCGEMGGKLFAWPDTLVGTDSHTTMINGLGVLGWGVGGIEAEAAMLGQPVSMLLPEVVGFELKGALGEGVTATDLVLTVTQMLRAHGVVSKFVEFYGDGLDYLSIADRATIANMAPEYGATVGIFPIDTMTLDYLALTGRTEAELALVEAYAKAQGMWRRPEIRANYSASLSLNLSEVETSIAGPKRPQDRISLKQAKTKFENYLRESKEATANLIPASAEADFGAEGGSTQKEKSETQEALVAYRGHEFKLKDGDVVIAAITSCTNTSNPSVMLAAGLVAKKARELGLQVKPWVKTSMAPGSQVVPAYLTAADLKDDLEALGFHVVGFGCTTCIGNSGPLPESIKEAIQKNDLLVASVLSGNRNFEGRIHADVKANYLASPPLVVAYALAGTMHIDLINEPLGKRENGEAVYLRDIWPTQSEINALVDRVISNTLFKEKYADVFAGTEQWQNLPVSEARTYTWPASTYIKNPPFFTHLKSEPESISALKNARCLVKVGDSITTDHISPAGAIHPDSPAGKYLIEQGVHAPDFNSLGSRRGNHEVMMRGTFANVRLRNQLAPDTVGGYTRYLPDNTVMPIYDAAMKYREDNTPLIVLAGKEYGTGSSRDWAAKGSKLLGIEVVLAESFERIHRSNLVGFGVLPLQFKEGENAASLELNGEEVFSFATVLKEGDNELELIARKEDGKETRFTVKVRIDAAAEWEYYRNGGILHTVVRKLAQSSST